MTIVVVTICFIFFILWPYKHLAIRTGLLPFKIFNFTHGKTIGQLEFNNHLLNLKVHFIP